MQDDAEENYKRCPVHEVIKGYSLPQPRFKNSHHGVNPKEEKGRNAQEWKNRCNHNFIIIRYNKFMKYILIIIAVLLVFWGGYKVMNRSTVPAATDQTEDEAAAGDTQFDESEVKTFNVTGKPYSFTPAEIRVKEGDMVRIVFTNEQGTHDWVIDEFDAKTVILEQGQSETIEFRATRKGNFEYYCSVGNHRALGMTGTLIVE